MLVIIWINGGFGAGKTTLAEELHRRLPDAVVYNPEDVGIMLWKWMRPNDDFQDLPSWRELVVATALSLRRHHAETLIVPMSLIRDAYRAEILGGLADAGEEVLHVFLEVDAGVLRERVNARVGIPANPGANQSAREWALSRVDRGRRRRYPPAGRDAPAAVGQAHPGRTGRRGAGCGWLEPGSRRRQADAVGTIARLNLRDVCVWCEHGHRGLGFSW